MNFHITNQRRLGRQLFVCFIFFLLTLAAVGFGLNTSKAQAITQTVPYKVNFQGRLTDPSGNIMPNGQYNMKFRLFNASSGGTNVWEEDYLAGGTKVQVTNGLFSIQLGSLTALSPSIFTNYPLYLEVELPSTATATCNTTSCASWTEGAMTPRQTLASSPYAMNADTVDGIDSTQLARTDQGNTFAGDNTFSGQVSAQTLVQNTHTVCDISNNCTYAPATGSANYIQNGSSPQTGQFNVTGNGTIGGSLYVSTVDSASGVSVLNLGVTNATTVNLATTTGSKTINIATGSGTNTVAIGSATTTTTIQGSNVKATIGSGVTIKSLTNSTTAFQVQSSAASTVLNVDTTNSRVGIGTATPLVKLDVMGAGSNLSTLLRGSTSVGSSTATPLSYVIPGGGSTTASASLSVTPLSASAAGLIIQGVASQTSDLLHVQDSSGAGIFNVNANGRVGIGVATPNNALSVLGNIAASGAINGGQGSPDYAENITASDLTVEAAEVVAIDPSHPDQIIKATGPYNPTALGVISTNPGFITNAEPSSLEGSKPTDSNQRPLALSGRVPVKVSDENGWITPGDYLTSSSTPGVAMKATAPGQVIGRAMGSFSSSSSATQTCGSYTCGKVLLFIDNSYYSPTGNLQPGVDTSFTNLQVADSITVGDNLNVGGLAILTNLAVTGDTNVQGNLTVSGNTTVADIIVNGHIVTAGNIPTVIVGQGAGVADTSKSIAQPTVTITGNDTSGTIAVTTGTNTSAGELAKLTFSTAFGEVPRVTLRPANSDSAGVEAYYDATITNASGFSIKTLLTPLPSKTYSFSYFVVQ